MKKKSFTQIKGILLILVAALLTSIGQFTWKLSAYFQGKLKYLFMLCGFVLFFVDGFLVVYAYRFGELSVLQPILSVGFVFSLIIGKLFFGETQSVYKYIGVILILVGVFILARSDNETTVD